MSLSVFLNGSISGQIRRDWRQEILRQRRRSIDRRIDKVIDVVQAKIAKDYKVLEFFLKKVKFTH